MTSLDSYQSYPTKWGGGSTGNASTKQLGLSAVDVTETGVVIVYLGFRPIHRFIVVWSVGSLVKMRDPRDE